MKIIHLSDLHIGYENLGRRFLHIANNIVFEKQPASDYVIVVTGDLVDDATDSANYDEAHMLLEKLNSAGYAVLVIPGNHDYGTGALGNDRYVAQFKQVFFGDQTVTYPKLDIIGKNAFIGLDSMAEELHWYDRLFAEGELGAPQLTRLVTTLQDPKVNACKFRILYLHHHPFDPLPFHRLKDSDELGAVLKKHGKIHALLYGHNHVGKKHNGHWGISRCYDAGSSTRKKGAPGPLRVLDLSRNARWDYEGDFHGPE